MKNENAGSWVTLYGECLLEDFINFLKDNTLLSKVNFVEKEKDIWMLNLKFVLALTKETLNDSEVLVSIVKNAVKKEYSEYIVRNILKGEFENSGFCSLKFYPTMKIEEHKEHIKNCSYNEETTYYIISPKLNNRIYRKNVKKYNYLKNKNIIVSNYCDDNIIICVDLSKYTIYYDPRTFTKEIVDDNFFTTGSVLYRVSIRMCGFIRNASHKLVIE